MSLIVRGVGFDGRLVRAALTVISFSVVLFGWVSIVVGWRCCGFRGCRSDLHRRRLRRKTFPRWPLLYVSGVVERRKEGGEKEKGGRKRRREGGRGESKKKA